MVESAASTPTPRDEEAPAPKVMTGAAHILVIVYIFKLLRLQEKKPAKRGGKDKPEATLGESLGTLLKKGVISVTGAVFISNN